MKFTTKINIIEGGGGPASWTRIGKDVEFDANGAPKNQGKIQKLNRKATKVIKDKKVQDLRGELPDDAQKGQNYGFQEDPKFDDLGFPFSGENSVRDFNKKDESSPRSLAFLSRVTAKTTAKRMFFEEFLRIVKSIYPDLSMSLPKPPTYRWKPKKEGQVLNIKEVKDSLLVKLPDLHWDSDGPGGVERSQLEFPDNSYAEMSIGEDGYHLMVRYYMDAVLPKENE